MCAWSVLRWRSQENGIEDETEDFDAVGIPDDTYTHAIHLSFNDDLTVD